MTAPAAPPRESVSPELVRTLCVVCGRNDSRPMYSFRPADLHETFHLERCPHCASAFVNPHPTRRAIRDFFSDERIFLSSTDPEGRSRSMVKERERRRSEFAGYVRRLKRMVPGGRVLDVGCGLGLFLEMMGPDYDRLGLDVNPLAVRFTRGKVGCPVLEMDAVDADFPGESFDLAAVMQTLDHFDRPGLMLERATGWLKSGGVLFLSALINIGGPMARLFKSEFRLLHPFHLVYFTPGGLKRLLADNGLRVVRLEYPYFRTPWFNRGEVSAMMKKTARRLFFPPKPAEYSPPFIGNTMNVYAVKDGA